MKQSRSIEGTNVSAALEITPQAGKRRDQRVVLHALSFLTPQAPSIGQSMIFIDTKRLTAFTRTRWRRGISLVDTGPSIAAENRGDGGVRPSGMLPHGRGDADAFSGHQRHRVNGNWWRVRHSGIAHLEQEMLSVMVTVDSANKQLVFAGRGLASCGLAYSPPTHRLRQGHIT